MPFTIPDKGEGLNDIQSIVFQEYLDILVAGISAVDSVASGCAVTTAGTNMVLATAAGVVFSNNVRLVVGAATPTIATADATNPRLDFIVVTSAGAVVVHAGTAGAAPKPPAKAANDVVLAVVFVPAGDTIITSNQIVDMRVIASAITDTAGVELPALTATVAANALTLGSSVGYLDFRSATLASGAISTIRAAPANIVVPSTATLGTVDARRNRLIVGVMNVAGVAELLVMNAILGNYLDESQLITTTILDAASDSAEVPYSATARIAMPFRILGYTESTQATAGLWATAPTLIQGLGAGAEIVQKVSFRAHQTTAQSVAGATFTKVLFQTENYDIGDNFASSAFTAPVSGLYAFSCAIHANAAAGQRCLLSLFVNGATVSRVFDFSTGVADFSSAIGGGTLRLAAGDVVEVFVWYTSAQNTAIGTSLTYFSGHRIG